MLVLSRRIGESVAIGDDVVVTVLDVRGDVVRVGVDAPRSVAVHRAEVLAELESSNRQAAAPSDDVVQSFGRAVRDRGDAATPEPGTAEGPEPGDPRRRR
ncbi:carbon storage regulator [Nocardioides mangrovicus]|uniref:Translational regulator CsrA n=1 Tax=Nocardioides mangrovicus TaxID=2478913 RepID=A0A3L8P1F6_9ACTN|nr:carbon storage regulator CsrA [Nocardioides mangrovicus]RLV48797.1 carbon storage regulator [Nocardioides mangrovicus]